MDEDVFDFAVWSNKAITFFAVKPFNVTLFHKHTPGIKIKLKRDIRIKKNNNVNEITEEIVKE